MSVGSVLQISTLAAAGILSVVACAWELRSAYALHLASGRGTDALRRAGQWTPTDGSIWRTLGLTLLKERSPSSADALRRAVAVNAFDAHALLGLAVEAETRGSVTEAENYYLRANRVSKRFRPCYALAAFYFRAQRWEEFWKVVSRGANIQGANAEKLFELAHAANAQPHEIPELLQLDSQAAVTGYFRYLLNARLLDNLADVGSQIAPGPDNEQLLLTACERIVSAGRRDEAIRIWNTLTQAGFYGRRMLDPDKGESLTNNAFEWGSFRGFDWRVTKLPGIITSAAAPSGFQFEFSGQQPASTYLLEQWLPVVPGRTYRVAVQYETSQVRGATGLSWVVLPFASSSDISISSKPFEAVPSGEAFVEFQAPPSTTLVRLRLKHTRVAGTVRIAGNVTLRRARLDLL